MPAPEDLEKAARAISDLLRGAQSRTLKPKEVNHLGPQVVAGIRILEDGARRMRERSKAGPSDRR
jgi:hypothetical protein